MGIYIIGNHQTRHDTLDAARAAAEKMMTDTISEIEVWQLVGTVERHTEMLFNVATEPDPPANLRKTRSDKDKPRTPKVPEQKQDPPKGEPEPNDSELRIDSFTVDAEPRQGVYYAAIVGHKGIAPFHFTGSGDQPELAALCCISTAGITHVQVKDSIEAPGKQSLLKALEEA